MIGPRSQGKKYQAACNRVDDLHKMYAKTYLDSSGKIQAGRFVFDHCCIVGTVAKELKSRMEQVCVVLDFPPGAELVAASHDCGKICPTFQKKIVQAVADHDPGSIPFFQGVNPSLETTWGGHAGVSQVTLQAAETGKFIPEIGGQHHGYSPPVDMYSPEAEVFGGRQWLKMRLELLDELKRFFQADWPVIETPGQARLLAGLTSVADWIGSGAIFDDPSESWQNRIARAVDGAGFIPPEYRSSLSFSDVFGDGYTPFPVQERFIDQVTGPGLYVLEAPMGVGKTEAALYAAYRLLCARQASGIYFALPTQLTSNKIYQRFNLFLQGILTDGCKHRQALLLHGKAWLQETELGGEGAPGRSWFNSAKRGLLAPFGVGTLDQALMAAMNVRHGFVRAFGLAGKVVILDEIHTYDAYTGTILDNLVELLRQLHCTVIVLSATLSQDRRRKLVGATTAESAFPLITVCKRNGECTEHPVAVPASECVSVALTMTDETAGALEEALDRAVQGQQVLWIENTVAEAQGRYLQVAARAADLGVACGLLHSRYTADDRQRLEESWVNLFGKPGWNKRQEQGRILIGTQVLEQSLDIDSDFMVTRFCPTDMLFQRFGRLWRHVDTPRHDAARREAWIIAPSLDCAIDEPVKYFGSSAWVYSPYVLCRSLEVWKERRDIEIPTEIRPLIEATYQLREETGKMARWLRELDQGTKRCIGRLALEQLARITLARGGKTLPETKAQTRYSEEETREVLLVRAMRMDPEKRCTMITLLTGETVVLPWQKNVLSSFQWRRLAALLMRQMVSVKLRHAPKPLPGKILRKLCLHHCLYLGNPALEEAVLRLALVEPTGHLRGYQNAPVSDSYIFQYRGDTGYTVHKKKE